ncbi:MAG TPA: heavy-metal-associated domain-containing protein [Kiritimatiellia bacterium]|nr:heavy-metal-associated domain-containing protein [Kiritimatiellia bacterium]
MKYVLSLFALMGVLVAGCRVSDVREMTVNVPAMSSDADVQRVRAALATLGGVDKEKTVYDVPSHTVKVRYDSMQIAHKNIEIAIAEAGYDANKISAIHKGAAK